jgi:sugar phosphate isomerase/epimerase
MRLRFSIPDYAFPKLEWEQALRLISSLGVQAVDVGLFFGRSHRRPEEVLLRPSQEAAAMASALHSNGLEVADVFGQAGMSFQQRAINHPDPVERRKAAEFFWRFVEFAARLNATHITLLPGVLFEAESQGDSLKRSAEELSWRVESASKLGIVLAVEPHVDSLIATPQLAGRLLDLAPDLSLTLDYGHFIYQGISDDEIEPLLARASHFHARAACPGKLQAPFEENAVDFARVLRAMETGGYDGYVALEYVWTDWMGCNQVDNLSETILLRDFLGSMASET